MPTANVIEPLEILVTGGLVSLETGVRAILGLCKNLLFFQGEFCTESRPDKVPGQVSLLHDVAYRGTSLIRKRRPPMTTIGASRYSPTAGSYGGAISYERGTPVCAEAGGLDFRAGTTLSTP